jgi:hypothetical protein
MGSAAVPEKEKKPLEDLLRKTEYSRWRRTSGGLRREVILADIDDGPDGNSEASKPRRARRADGRVGPLASPLSLDPRAVTEALQTVPVGTAKKCFWEIFGAAATTTKFVSHLGEGVIAPLDSAHSSVFDVLNPVVREAVLRFAATAPVGWCWIRPPEDTWGQ